jgi:hypothetical protein
MWMRFARRGGNAMNANCLAEGVYQPRDKLHQLVQRWNNRLKGERLSFAEDYISGRLAIAFIVLSSFGVGGGKSSGQNEDRVGGEIVRTIFVVNAKDAHFCHGTDSDQEPVFVGPVEVIQTNKKIASVVRAFIIGNYFSQLRGESLYFSVSRLIYQRLPVFIYREGGFYRVFPCRNVDGSGDVIEGASEVMDGVTDNAGQIVSGTLKSRASNANAAAILTRLRISANRDGVNVKVLEGMEPSLYIEDVLVGPFDL